MPPGYPQPAPPPPPPPPRPPAAPYARTETGALWALVAAIGGVAFGVVGVLVGVLILLSAGGDLAGNFALGNPALSGFVLGVPALVLGPIAYFLGKSSEQLIAESDGKLGGRSSARSAWLIAIAATTLGAITTLMWLVLMLLGFFGSPPA